MNIVKLRSIYEGAQEDCERFAGEEFDDVLALVQQDAALGAQLRALSSLSEIESSGLSEVLLKFEIWWSNHEDAEPTELSSESASLLRSIHADLIRIAGGKK